MFIEDLNILGKKARTDEEYKVVLKAKIKLYISMSLVGVITLVVAMLSIKGSTGHQSDFLSGVYTGTGSAILAVSIVRIIRTRGIVKNAAKIREKRLEAHDERNILVAQKAHFLSGSVVFILAYIGILSAGFFSMAVFWTLWAFVVIYLVLFLLIKIYYNKKI